ncbi:MAG: hypothetical protein E6K59_01495, partial [Nitrospirae bacterium]
MTHAMGKGHMQKAKRALYLFFLRSLYGLRSWSFLAILFLIASPLWGGQPGTFTPKGNLNQSRGGHTATLLPNGTVLIVGGKDASGRSMATAEIFDPATGQYTELLPTLPVPVSGHTATLLKNGTVLIAGGVAESGTPIGFAQVFDPATSTFSGPKLMAVSRSEHTATLLTKDGRVLIAGGTDGSASLADLELYDQDTGSFSRVPTTLQVARRSHTAALLDDGTVLLAGGSDPAGALSSAELYNPAANTVVAVGSLNAPRMQASAALLLNGTVFVAGGKNFQGEDLNSAEIYDPPTKSFTQLAALMTSPRSGHVGVTLQDNGKVLLLGGTNAGQLVTGVELYDPVTGTFRTVGAPATARTRAATNFFAVPYTGGMLASGGQDANQNPLASSELFSYPTLRTDKQDYPPGYVVRMLGEGWQPNEEISILIHETGNPDFTMVVSADAAGAFAFDAFQTQSKDIGMSFLATASGPQTNWTAQARFTDSVTSATITSPTTGSPVTVTALPANVTISFNYSTSAGSTTGQASIEGSGNTTVASNSKSLTPGTGSDSITVTIPAGTANGSYNAKVQVNNSTGSGPNNKTDTQSAAVIVNVVACTAPSITTNPSNQTVEYGQNATFSAAASGNPTPTVQWQVSTNGGTIWSDISGATSTTLTVTAPTVAQSGNKYRAVFTNSCG